MSSIYFLLWIPFVQVSLCSGWYTEISIFTKAEESDYYSLSNFDVNASQRISIKVVIISESGIFSPSNCLIKTFTMEME